MTSEKIQKIFINKDNTVTLVCPHCGTNKTVNAAKLKDKISNATITVKCACKLIFRVNIEFRKEYQGKIWLEVLIIPDYNDSHTELTVLKQAFEKIKPDSIHLNTLDRPGVVPGIRAATRTELQEIVDFWKLENVEIIAAAQEERFTRKKHDPGFPNNAINYVLSAGNLSLEQIDYVAFYDKPFLKFERLLETYLACAPKGFNSFRMAMPIWLREKLFLKSQLTKQLKKIDKQFKDHKLLFGEHHLSHAASAFYPSPFEQAVVLTLDGVGEWATTTVAIGNGNKLDIVKEIHFPHSLGLLYSAFTYYLGFRVNSGEYKLMGLAPYGEPKYVDLIYQHLIDLKPDGSFNLNMKYFGYMEGLKMTSALMEELFDGVVKVIATILLVPVLALALAQHAEEHHQ